MTDYSDREALDLVLADWKREIHNCFPAKVLSYDATAQTVAVRPAVVRSLSGATFDSPLEYEELPDLPSVPVQWSRAGGFAITFPIAVGDWVRVHCADNALHIWRQRGIAPSKPGINDEHGLNGCWAEVGCYPDKEKLSGVSTSHVELRGPAGGVVRLKADGTVELCGTSAVALADLVKSAVDQAIVGHAHASLGGAGAYLPALPTGCPSVAATKVKGS